eukprot:CAMPEP_0198363064 /NCGR_PEP_ID=MMETSP1450-20131203/148437_1 /TAXON_ID=753684 ORGANISM="Madagascaria erythrocladiodes, Strain CCMP3234" /NCGR_SAMPLE_ID=MMETSP1450 /ASSEMBLY_ACC=CAM_ASM_001115 /LENGTH=47 /DNA_ID= /DNA_START= /DNA_END= /DNA_ORIENTATION=
MASVFVVVDLGPAGRPGKRVRVPLTPMTPLSAARDQACQQAALSSPA